MGKEPNAALLLSEIDVARKRKETHGKRGAILHEGGAG
jgi:hypothetical protein